MRVKMNIDKLIAGLPDSDTKKLCQQRLNAVKEAQFGNIESGSALRDAIDVELMKRLEAPADGWSKGVQGEPRYLMQQGEKVAVVYRNETHGADRGDYGIEVRGQVIDGSPRHVHEAQALAEHHPSLMQ
jgi:hypothetical protein